MSFLTYEQKAEALQELSGRGSLGLSVKMRRPGDWFCTLDRVDITDGSGIWSLIGNGESPAETIEDLWDKATRLLPPGRVLIVNNDWDQCYIWNGSRWQRTLRPANV